MSGSRSPASASTARDRSRSRSTASRSRRTPGDTIASALYAGGRSDLLALVQVPPPPRRDGLGGAGRELADAGRRRAGHPRLPARSCARAWSSSTRTPGRRSTFDVMRMSDMAGGPFTPPGFYYKTFKWPAARGRCTSGRCAASPASAGCPSARTTACGAPSTGAATATCSSIGGGIAGLSAAIAARAPGRRRRARRRGRRAGRRAARRGRSRARPCAGREARDAGVEMLSEAPALGFYDGLVPVWQGDTLHQVRAKRHVAATGAIEQPLVFKDNDLPGVMMAGGARRLAALWAVRPGTHRRRRDDGRPRARRRARAARGRRPDRRRRRPAPGRRRPRARRRACRPPASGCCGHDGRARAGQQRRRRRRSSRASTRRGRATGTLEEVPCDLLAVSGGTAPATSLLLQSGAKARYDAATSRFLAELGDGIVHAAGAVAGHEDADAAAAPGPPRASTPPWRSAWAARTPSAR